MTNGAQPAGGLPLRTRSLALVAIAGAGPDARLLLVDDPDAGFWTHGAIDLVAGKTVEASVRELAASYPGPCWNSLYAADFVEQFYDVGTQSVWLVPAFVAAAGAAAIDERPGRRWCTLDEARALAPFPNQHLLYEHAWRFFVEREPSELLRLTGSPG